MDIVLHAGAHCTDEDRLVKCLLKNKDLFLQRGVAVPGPSRYRRLLRDAVQALGKGEPAEGAREILLDSILEHDGVQRLLLSNENVFGVPKIAVSDGVLYPQAAQRIADLGRLFPGDRLVLALGIRNPATFLPALFAQSPQEDFLTFLDGTDPATLRWSELVERIRAAHPDLPLVLWCNEDTPLIWGSVLRAVAGLEEGTKIGGAFDLLSEIMSREGMQRFRAYLSDHPVMTEPQKRRVMGAFLDKYALEDEIEEELDLPGWDEGYVEMLTQRYEADVAAIEERGDVHFIAA
ncbi:hypothetical protein [Pseudooceanicola nanhaiensis]|jgi:hypothetical protein|uniref:Uncharacterized protein n=1 Tax=Pseudooceanicola nanhaiensis TaxID=375761 RepID=A0A917WC96_9RHOB|nr:hypothetical protein [Pseudooceanicola nanhaiensis]GGL90824.1 hypothetical protein GCM10011534_11210 [Pseudooceanicola nanhaiensis]